MTSQRGTTEIPKSRSALPRCCWAISALLMSADLNERSPSSHRREGPVSTAVTRGIRPSKPARRRGRAYDLVPALRLHRASDQTIRCASPNTSASLVADGGLAFKRKGSSSSSS